LYIVHFSCYLKQVEEKSYKKELAKLKNI
jgi:hypothetical protein